jgi:hypothetical protein
MTPTLPIAAEASARDAAAFHFVSDISAASASIDIMRASRSATMCSLAVGVWQLMASGVDTIAVLLAAHGSCGEEQDTSRNFPGTSLHLTHDHHEDTAAWQCLFRASGASIFLMAVACSLASRSANHGNDSDCEKRSDGRAKAGPLDNSAVSFFANPG